MSKKNLLKISVIILGVLIFIGIIIGYAPSRRGEINIQVSTNSDVVVGEAYQVYYLTDDDVAYTEDHSVYADVKPGETNELQFTIPGNTKEIRFDFGITPGVITIEEFVVSCGNVETEIDFSIASQYINSNGIKNIENKKDEIIIETNSSDAFLVWNIDTLVNNNLVNEELQTKNIIAKVIACVIDVILLVLFVRKYDDLVEFPTQIYQSKKLILQLSKNDFKTKYAGSYLGMIWAFIQPVITVLVYWFVFGVGLRSGDVMEVPFVLWLIAGLVPWFFFSDAWSGGTNALIEYQYLVKKVVFQIDILPLVKVLSAMFVHVFFVLFTIILYTCYGYSPDLYTLQVIYYSFCVFVLALGLSYITSAVVGFFRDLSQIVGIILQVGVWMTPIMWNMDGMGLPIWLTTILKLNPMYYIVAGFRNSLIAKVWFWEDITLTMYFWGLVLFILGAGALIFKKLKVHFADVL